jgi:hypothetical protein
MKWLVVMAAGLACAGMISDAANAAPVKRKVQPVCADQPTPFSLERLIFATRPQPNGCAPPVYANGTYVGQDPDANIRAYLRHDPQSGYDGPQQ